MGADLETTTTPVPDEEEIRGLVGHKFPGGTYTVERWENFLLSECTGVEPLPGGIVHPVALFHVPILGCGTTIAEMFAIGRAESDSSIVIESYDWEIFQPLKEDVPLKAYNIQDFDPDRFSLGNETGEVAVVFKDFLFDRKKQIALVYVIVSEQHLTQHLRIAIVKKEKGWKISRAEGQKFFPTPGIARALELVYQAAKETVSSEMKRN